MTREYKHPKFDHVFIIKDISLWEIEIDGVRVNREDCKWLEIMANYGLRSETTNIHDLAMPLLQTILSLTKSDTNDK